MGRLNASGLWRAGAAVFALQLCGIAVAAPNSPNSIAAMSIAGELFAGAILTGAVVFFAMAGFLFLKGSYRAKRAEARFAEEAATRWVPMARVVLTIEILSPSTTIVDRGRKRRLYVEAGVTEYWIVDAEAETLEIFVPDEGGVMRLVATYRGDATARSPASRKPPGRGSAQAVLSRQ